MSIKTIHCPGAALAAAVCLVSAHAAAQGVLFDFETAPLHTALPITLTAGDVTARFTATGQGFSVQRADTMGFTPQGFSGFCLYPDSVFAADLQVDFSVNLTSFSILYAPQELGCDASATMRVTASLDSVPVATAVTNAQAPGTWPTETLALTTTNAFNRVVVHYDKRPACADYGPIFMADNMTVTPAPRPTPVPSLRISGVYDQVEITWPTNAVGFVLESVVALGDAAAWGPVPDAAAVNGGDYTLRLSVGATNTFYRLNQPAIGVSRR